MKNPSPVTADKEYSHAIFAGDGVIVFGVEGLEFGAEVDVKLSVKLGDTTIWTDVLRLKVSPFLLLPHTQDAEKVHITDHQDANDLAAQLGGISERHSKLEGRWLQDHVEIGYAAAPAAKVAGAGGGELRAKHIVMRLPYDTVPAWPYSLLAPDVGVYYGMSLGTAEAKNFGGNLELIPHSPEYPLGRIMVGSNMDATLQEFFKVQAVQKPFEIDVDWLRVGHVDECISILPELPANNPNGYRIMLASPSYARELLVNGDPDNGIAAPPSHAAVFADGATGHGDSQTVINPDVPVWLFDGVAHDRIRCISAADHVDGETVTITDGAVTKTFEYDDNDTVAGGNVAVDIIGEEIAEVMRDRLKTAIAAQNMDIVLEDDGDFGIILINKNFGAGNNNTAIVSMVADANYVVEGMGGGKAVGRDFTAGGTWKYIRLYNGTGSGQVASIMDRGVGFVRIDEVWDTTSNIAGVDGALDQSLWGRMDKDLQIGVPLALEWFTAPGADTQYIVSEDSQLWRGRVRENGQVSGWDQGEIPALQSVSEVLSDQGFDDLNARAESDIAGYKNEIINSMGKNDEGEWFLGDNDFVKVPVLFTGRWDGVDITNGGAYFPNLVNCQPVSAELIVMSRQYGARNAAGEDVFQKAAMAITGAGVELKFANDWNHYHRYFGNVHCATSAQRQIQAFKWWEKKTP